MSQDQFFQEGFAERKLILILDLYDYLKEVKHAQRVQTTLSASDSGPYPSDIPTRVYEVVNHRTNEATKFHFAMNATLQLAKTTVLQKTDLPPVGKLIQGHRFNEAHYQKVMKENDENASAVNSSVYSLSRSHHDRKQKRKKRSTSLSQRKRTTTIDVIKEETVESAALKDSIQGCTND